MLSIFTFGHLDVFFGEMSVGLWPIFDCLILSCLSYLYIWGVNTLSLELFENIFFSSVGSLFCFVYGSFAGQNL